MNSKQILEKVSALRANYKELLNKQEQLIKLARQVEIEMETLQSQINSLLKGLNLSTPD